MMSEIENMVTAVRLTTEEQEVLREKCIEINKLLVKDNKMPIRQSELIHKILEKTMSYVTVDNEGEIIINL